MAGNLGGFPWWSTQLSHASTKRASTNIHNYPIIRYMDLSGDFLNLTEPSLPQRLLVRMRVCCGRPFLGGVEQPEGTPQAYTRSQKP